MHSYRSSFRRFFAIHAETPIPTIITATICLSAALSIAARAEAAIYKWTNANGRTVYSETPPPSGRVTVVAPRVHHPSAEASQAQRQKTLETLQRLRDKQEDRELARQKQADARAKSQYRKSACRQARHRLQSYESLGHRRIRGKDGNYYYPTDPQRSALIKKAREQVKTFCGN